MITLKRSDLSPVHAINTPEKGREGHRMSNADTERGRRRGKGGARLRWSINTKV